MRSRATAILIAFTMLTVVLPAGMANHLSVGVHDTVGNAPEESESNPSVPGLVDDLGTNDSAYGIGTTVTEHCHEPEANVTEEEIDQAASMHAFCGVLHYNANTTFAEPGPPDQVYNDDFVGLFDVQRVYWSGWFPISTCIPYCEQAAGQDGPGNATWDAIHTAGSLAGLTDTPEEADQREREDGDSRSQTYYVNLDFAHAPGHVQRSTGAWQMDGWTIPTAFERFVGFIEDSGGDTITDEELKDHINGLVTDGDLAADTTPQVCGYVPQRTFSSTGEQSFCDTPLLYRSQNDDQSTYEDPCQSPTYVCSPTTQRYWGSESVGIIGAYGGDQDDYLQWHWVIAPNQPECAFTMPGFDLDGDASGGDAFLAHDLDVYTPVTATSGDPHVSYPGIDDYAEALEGEAIDQLPNLPDVTDTEEVYEFAANNTTVAADGLLEPNYVDADTGEPFTIGIDDNSRQALVEERSLTDCELIVSDEEADTVDDWVNYIDSGVENTRDVSVFGDLVDVDEDPPTVGTYTTGDEDENNDAFTDEYSTKGFVGIFTDKDDDGAYEPITGSDDSDDLFSPEVWKADSIYDNGAYPMAWDMHVEVDEATEEASPDRDAGCTFTGDQNFPAVMEDAGYGPNTGLAQAIYLSEPTVFEDVDTDDPQALPFPGGNNIYVQLNQAGRTLWDGNLEDGTDTYDLSEKIDTLVEGLRDHVVAEQGATENGLDIVQPGATMGLESDYFSQCNASTGGFDSDLDFTHSCETGCRGDTIATLYAFEVNSTDGTIGGGEIPLFQIDDKPHDFGAGGAWYDIDAFDGTQERSEERMDPPPT